eukprot:c15544_g1_i2.p1 GENE.c15544_g1_i2~~c15544_g1_i2.p1  ORF type:complete len:188 (-),score=67.25 c15544_g1_i2:12-575(-)
MHRSGAKKIILKTLRSTIEQPKNSLKSVAEIFDIVNRSYVEAIKSRSEAERSQVSSSTSVSTLNPTIPNSPYLVPGTPPSPLNIPRDFKFHPPTRTSSTSVSKLPFVKSVIDQEDIFYYVFLPSYSDEFSLRSQRLMQCLRLYIVSLHIHFIQVSSSLFELLIRLFSQCNCLDQLDMCIRYNVIDDR